jgi:hypothetical protein
MSTKHKIILVTVLEKGRKKPTTHVACLWNRSSLNPTFYPDAYFHFTPHDLKVGKLNSTFFECFTLIDHKVIGVWA